MTQSSPQHRSRALIVEDEPLCALDLEAHMHADQLGAGDTMGASQRSDLGQFSDHRCARHQPRGAVGE